MKKALIIMADGAEEYESVSVIDILNRGGIQVDIGILKNSNSPVMTGSHNMQIIGTALLKDLENNQYDAVIIPGGMQGAENCRKSALVGTILKKQQENKRWTAAICAAPGLVLTKHGILNADIKATGYPGTTAEIKNLSTAGVEINNEYKVITGKGPFFAPEFAFAILKCLTNEQKVDEVKSGMLENK